MGWERSTRRKRLPVDWARRRILVLQRDRYRCRRCGATATEVDHVVPGDDHRLTNLQALCKRCHGSKTGTEGAAAVAGRPRRTPPRPELRAERPIEQHPGFVKPETKRRNP